MPRPKSVRRIQKGARLQKELVEKAEIIARSRRWSFSQYVEYALEQQIKIDEVSTHQPRYGGSH